MVAVDQSGAGETNAMTSIDNVIDALANFIQPLVGGAQIVRAQVNRVPMPIDSCIVLTELLEVDIDVPYQTYDDTNQQTSIIGPTRIDVQIDFYGATAGDQCKAVKQAFRSTYGFDAFPAEVKPLYTSDGIQSPLITGEEQYESRWTLTASMQYNPVVTLSQQSANATSINILEAADLL